MENFIKINSDYENIDKNEVGVIQDQNNKGYKVFFMNRIIKNDVPKNISEMIDPRKTGDDYDYKICVTCGRCLPVTCFKKNQHGKNNRIIRRPSCIYCRKSRDGKNMNNKEKEKWEEKKPNLLFWQCPICKKTTIPGVTTKIVLDHDHKTGHPRTWICDSCNTGLGRFEDNTDILKNAINYLDNRDSF